MNCNSCVKDMKKINYSVKKCGICSKRCLFRVKKMLKCKACKRVYHKRCLAAAETKPDEVIAVESPETIDATTQPAVGPAVVHADTPVEQLATAVSPAVTANKPTEMTRMAAELVIGHADAPVEQSATAVSSVVTAIKPTEMTRMAAELVTGHADAPVEQLATAVSSAVTAINPNEMTRMAAGPDADNVYKLVKKLAAAGNIADIHGQRLPVVWPPVSGAPRRTLTRISAASGHQFQVLMDVVARVFGPAPAAHALLRSNRVTSTDRLSRQVTEIRSFKTPLTLPSAQQAIAVFGRWVNTNETCNNVYSKPAGNIADNHGQRPTVVWPVVMSGAPRRTLTRTHGSAASGHQFQVLMDVVARVFGPFPAAHALLWSNHVTSSHRLSQQVAVIRSCVPPLTLPATQQTITVFGQRSYTNKTGNKVYSKAYLAQLESETVCPNKPDTLCNLVKITRSTLELTRDTKKRTIHKGKTKTIHMSLSLREEVQLNKTDNAWVPTVAKKNKNKNEDELKTEYIERNVRSILNKITPDSMVPLTERFKALPIDTFGQLEKTIDLVYEKAIEEQCFAPLYASLCSAMQSTQVRSNDNKILSFKKILISKCQHRFELDKAQHSNDITLRKRAVGNIRFIGELFNSKILTPNVIYYCCENLVIRHFEAPLECLCTLLRTAGKELERSYNLDDIFDKLKALTDKDTKYKIPTRIKFMIQDIIELRRNKWTKK